ncbi:hypothetical protein [Selenomonas ruminantium]|uniref:Uncharacterized protein n=1 Tax=Selenomonas ruminantium TaxID=971 RepID=A0A1K1NK68_SELRU|nr:hypothetical protein [Selenomonas ruminantium]SFW35716.1 hypothetical protein SAMN02910323_1432 [Selenomonas ruminantium]
MKKKNVLTAVGLAGVFAISGAFLPGNTGQKFVRVSVAEAGFGLGNIGDVVKGEAKKEVAKTFNVDLDGLQDKRQNMMLNLYRAAICYGHASGNVQQALGLGDGGAQLTAAIKQAATDKTNMGFIQAVVEKSKVDDKAATEAAKKLQDSGDAAKIQQANDLLRSAKAQRRAANIYKILAARDAVGIIKDAGMAMAKGGDSIQDKIDILKDLSSVAKNAETLTKAIGKNHKGMSKALKTYEQKQNIKDVSDDEAKKQVESLPEM